MLIMLYGTESKSRNADFILIARKGDTTTLGPEGRQTYEPSGQGPVNLKNPHTAGVSSEPRPQSGPLLPLIPHCKKSQYIIN